ncbi:MAG: helix-turn-helix domain-containing protein [Defluviitaleaceae bacterium]|nr:helix-turn-helix domain-containing protein [Defluviitaleaceae bacterium]MCL2217782.1 helix-turn-helix domain-containing protein [Defluviitaleaceae bacterium]
MIAERLRTLRREKNLNKRDLVSMLPLNYSTYANYESGFREPNSEVLQILARHYGVSIDYLLGVSDNRKKADEIAILNDEEHDHVAGYRQLDAHGREIVDLILKKEIERVNFLSTRTVKQSPDEQWVSLQVYQQRASAGLGNYLTDDSDIDFEIMRFASTPVSQKADFCVKIKGDSMEPKICDGDIVFVKAVPKVDPDNVGIFVYDGEAYCKRLRIDQKRGAILLESLNKSFAPKHITMPDNLKTVGLVIGIAE